MSVNSKFEAPGVRTRSQRRAALLNNTPIQDNVHEILSYDKPKRKRIKKLIEKEKEDAVDQSSLQEAEDHKIDSLSHDEDNSEK